MRRTLDRTHLGCRRPHRRSASRGSSHAGLHRLKAQADGVEEPVGKLKLEEEPGKDQVQRHPETLNRVWVAQGL